MRAPIGRIGTVGNFDFRTHDRVELFDAVNEVKRRAGFRYADGRRINVGDTVILKNDLQTGLLRVRALNPSGMRVVVSNQTSGALSVEPGELDLVHSMVRGA